MISAQSFRSTRAFLPDLKERCAFVEDTVRYKSLATAEELAAYKPGGEENPNRNLPGWVTWWANLIRFNAREELKETKREVSIEGGERAILEALRDAPVYLELQRSAGAEPRRLAAHPKSFEALEFIDACGRTIAWLAEQIRRLQSLSAEPLAAADREIIHQYGLIALAVTHAGPGLPFPAEDPPTQLPEWIRELSSVDIARIHGAYQQANLLRLHALYLLLELKTGEQETNNRLSWATFFSTRAEESGVQPQTLMRDRSLGSQIAAALITAESRNRALAESKKES